MGIYIRASVVKNTILKHYLNFTLVIHKPESYSNPMGFRSTFVSDYDNNKFGNKNDYFRIYGVVKIVSMMSNMKFNLTICPMADLFIVYACLRRATVMRHYKSFRLKIAFNNHLEKL